MNIAELSDSDLLSKTKDLVAREKSIVALVLSHLQEVERRKLYAEFNYSSLFEYCVKELKYSEGQTFKRISAMRLSKKSPSVKKQIKRGNLSLTNAGLLSSLFRDLKLDKLHEESVVNRVSGQSKRECQNIIAAIREEHGIGDSTPKKMVIKHETATSIRLTISIPRVTMDKINELRGIFGHKNLEMCDLLDKMADSLIDKHRRRYSSVRKGTPIGSGRYIPQHIKEKTMVRANYRCEKCGSVHALEFDHITPFAVGGKSELSNIRVLCRNCNLREAIKIFGVDKISGTTRKRSIA